MHKKPHTCGESYFKRCRDFYEPGHTCYMIPARSPEPVSLANKASISEVDVDTDDKERKNPLYIFFYFECTQENIYQCEDGCLSDVKTRKCKNCKKSICGALEHTPHLCIAHKVCSTCINMDINSSSLCINCGKSEHFLSDESTTDDFCKWLFSEENYGATVNLSQLQSISLVCHFDIFI